MVGSRWREWEGVFGDGWWKWKVYEGVGGDGGESVRLRVRGWLVLRWVEGVERYGEGVG